MSLTNIATQTKDASLKSIAEKVYAGTRITDEDALCLYEHAGVAYLGALANFIRETKHGLKVYFNRNFHIEPTNLCVFHCEFCSYSRTLKDTEEGWFMGLDQIMHIIDKYEGQPVTEVHIVGGVHPKLNMNSVSEMLRAIKQRRPDLHIKGFTAVELEYIFRKANLSMAEGMRLLNEAGLDSLPGGGAEIFAEEVRMKICPDKANAEQWLAIHEAAHNQGMHSNATMLYGHIENFAQRVDHMRRLRELQDRTKGFNTFIPLKFRHEGNNMQNLQEVSVVEDLRNYAISRIYMDNFPHIKAYWPMIGRQTAALSLSFGVSDLDGTIDDSTKIYSMAGSEEQHPSMSTEELVKLINHAGKVAIERDTLYNVVKQWV